MGIVESDSYLNVNENETKLLVFQKILLLSCIRYIRIEMINNIETPRLPFSKSWHTTKYSVTQYLYELCFFSGRQLTEQTQNICMTFVQ